MFKSRKTQESVQTPNPPAPEGNANKNGEKGHLNGTLLVRVVGAVNIGNLSLGSLPYGIVEFDKNEALINAKDGGGDKPPLWQARAHFDVSKESNIVISFYQKRIVNNEENVILLGTTVVEPIFEDQKMVDDWFPIKMNEAEGLCDDDERRVHIQVCYKPAGAKKSLSIDEFELLKVIGKGSFGKVMQVRKKDTNRIYAMKIIRKSHVVERSEISHTLAERNVLVKINNPFIVGLKFSFQTAEKLYLVLAFVNGGELFYHLQKDGAFTEDRSRFYISELLCALECLHKYDIIYRDLKPENILLDYSGHIALCDFGLCKLNMTDKNKTNTFCGTPEYLAPELLLGKGYTKVVDWWTLGVLLYEMMTGLPPFYDENTNEMYKKILQQPLTFPSEMSPLAQDILSKLLNREPTERLGNNGSEEIKAHPFFGGIDWVKLYNKKYQPPFKPSVSSATDTSNFDEEFTSEVPLDSVSNEGNYLSATVQQQFEGFTYEDRDKHIGSMVSSSLMSSTLTSRPLSRQVGMGGRGR
ncbi:kinase-like protein [Anaeromyces robustus]|uniref:non-specific serine/threonine protein kinase n=1 Tax=Anaeromyces robustus TaxID=1754192 RepID=A0A1Y1X9U4_9FUNG|nr:kinase-like protein [Anaeromyces robustus]|eukprot:ORX82508.1 kinase-like protein [Anaeromyces robustus]